MAPGCALGMYSREACIAGVGTSESFGFSLGRSPLALQGEALRAALADCGLPKSAIDGVATSHGAPRGVDYEEFVLAAGLSIRWASQMWSHGRWAATTVTQAALAVTAGLADYVAVADTTTTARGYGRHLARLGGGNAAEGLRDVGGGHGEWDVHGLDTPGAATALVAQAYMDAYGATADHLADVALAFREHANANPMAIMRDKKMTRQSYFDEPVIAGPFRRADYCLSNEGSVCLIVTTCERARDLAKAPAVIAGMAGLRASRDDYVLFARPGLGVGIQRQRPLATPAEAAIYTMAGVGRDELSGLYVYDSFGSNLWMVLERFGFCGEGEAPHYVRDKGIGPGASMPVNTNGGLMSEAHLSGYGHLTEMVRQLRGDAGQRQIGGAAAVQWATPRGDSLILTKER
jgi:acetyl-CoA acetyltransferase